MHQAPGGLGPGSPFACANQQRQGMIHAGVTCSRSVRRLEAQGHALRVSQGRHTGSPLRADDLQLGRLVLAANRRGGVRQVRQLLRLDLEQVLRLPHGCRLCTAHDCVRLIIAAHSAMRGLMSGRRAGHDVHTSSSLTSRVASCSFRSFPAAMSCSLAEASSFPCARRPRPSQAQEPDAGSSRCNGQLG